MIRRRKLLLKSSSRPPKNWFLCCVSCASSSFFFSPISLLSCCLSPRWNDNSEHRFWVKRWKSEKSSGVRCGEESSQWHCILISVFYVCSQLVCDEQQKHAILASTRPTRLPSAPFNGYLFSHFFLSNTQRSFLLFFFFMLWLWPFLLLDIQLFSFCADCDILLYFLLITYRSRRERYTFFLLPKRKRNLLRVSFPIAVSRSPSSTLLFAVFSF